MPKKRSPEREQAFDIWESSKNKILLKDIAILIGVSESQVRKWKSQDNWEQKDIVTLPKDINIVKSNVTNKMLVTKVKTELPTDEKRVVEKGLNGKQELFCRYYINSFNATQAYLKAYQCSYDVANAEGYKLLVKPCVKAEVERLKNIKRQSIMIGEDDIVERYMRIAFADMTDFVEFGRVKVPVMTMFGPMMETDPSGKQIPVMKEINEVRFKDGSTVDGGLICQIKQGKDGASIKLEDRQKALDWLSNYFNMNPMNQHKQEYDKLKIVIEEKKLALAAKTTDIDPNTVNENIKSLADLLNAPVKVREVGSENED